MNRDTRKISTLYMEGLPTIMEQDAMDAWRQIVMNCLHYDGWGTVGTVSCIREIIDRYIDLDNWNIDQFKVQAEMLYKSMIWETENYKEKSKNQLRNIMRTALHNVAVEHTGRASGMEDWKTMIVDYEKFIDMYGDTPPTSIDDEEWWSSTIRAISTVGPFDFDL
jgi:hypothetical protein